MSVNRSKKIQPGLALAGQNSEVGHVELDEKNAGLRSINALLYSGGSGSGSCPVR